MPKTFAIRSAALTKLRVITPTAGVPTRSLLIASCKLHDEQLPQSPQSSDGEIPTLCVVDDLVFGGSAVIRFCSQDYLSHLIALSKQPVHVGEESCRALFAIRDEPDCLPFKTLQSRRWLQGTATTDSLVGFNTRIVIASFPFRYRYCWLSWGGLF